MIGSDDLHFFTVLARCRTLAECARRLDVTPPAVTQRLKGLEERLGIRLIDRAGRALALTDEGLLVESHARVVADAIESLTDALADRRKAVVGHLRVAAPLGFGRMHVAPVLNAFAKAYPAVRVTLDVAEFPGARLIDTFDVVIHIGHAPRLDEIVTTLAPNRRILCASPAYLDDAPAVDRPSDLARHRCVTLRENDEDVTLWRFEDAAGRPETVRVRPALCSNDGSVVVDWALAGQGIAIRSEWSVAADLAAGRLRRVLPLWDLPSADVVALLGTKGGRSARAAIFVDMLRDALSPVPWRPGQP